MKNLTTLIFKSLIFAVLSAPFFAVVGLIYHMSVKNILSLDGVTKELVSVFTQKSCSGLGVAQLGACVWQQNTNFIIFLSVCATLVFLAKLTETFWQKIKFFQMVSGNLGFILLLGPVFYYAYVYLPISLSANNPRAFLFLASAVFAHIMAITIIDFLHHHSFKNNKT